MKTVKIVKSVASKNSATSTAKAAKAVKVSKLGKGGATGASALTAAKAWNRLRITSSLRMNGIDGAASWLGNEISDKLCNSLVEGASKLNSAKLGTFDKVLVIDARQVFAWKVCVSGDVYGRKEGMLTVRGSLSALRSVYGAGNVAVVGTADAAHKLHKSKKWDKDCALALGLN